jgi:surface antigen
MRGRVASRRIVAHERTIPMLRRATAARLGGVVLMVLALILVASPVHADDPGTYGYPYPNAPDCNENTEANCIPDAWYFYQGQCTSWVSYRLNQLNGFGDVPFNNYYLQGKIHRWGDAASWGEAADRAGIPRNDTPAVGAVAWFSRGHVGYVERINADGSVVMSEMNYDNHNAFRFRVLRRGSDWPTSFIHIRDRTQATGVTAAARNRDGRLELFGIGLAGEVFRRWQRSPGGSWSPWLRMDGASSGLAAATNADGRVELFAVGLQGEVFQRWQRAPGGQWSPWRRMSGTLAH